MKLRIQNGKLLTKECLLEQLRYAGVLNIEDNSIILYPPAKVQVKNWAEQNKGRMASFGIIVIIEK